MYLNGIYIIIIVHKYEVIRIENKYPVDNKSLIVFVDEDFTTKTIWVDILEVNRDYVKFMTSDGNTITLVWFNGKIGILKVKERGNKDG